MIPLLGVEIILEVIMLFIYPFSRIPVPIFSRCMRGHVASCCRKEGSMQKTKNKKGWEKPKANEINKGDRDVRSLSYRMVMSFRICSQFSTLHVYLRDTAL